MEREVGSKEFPVWLLGDLNPTRWEDDLETPFDPASSAAQHLDSYTRRSPGLPIS